MRNRTQVKAIKASVVLMFGALTLLFVYMANVAPFLRVLLFFLSSVFIMGIMLEQMYGSAFLAFGIVTFVGFILVPDKAGMLPYLLFFGHYGIFKYFADNNLHGGTKVALKLVYFNICAAAIYFFGGGFLLALLPWELPVWLLIVLAEAIFLLYDWLFGKLTTGYFANMRPRLTGGSSYG
ncbi:hypothetical protein LJC56_06410 [Christensenellaceae bacterium OttesenSCG-928-K19]|nr:hypothetical protein [Christensenellaceae bacterium OttesenSCG-928-K19]